MNETDGWESAALSFAQTTVYDAIRLIVWVALHGGKRRQLRWVVPLVERALTDGFANADVPKRVASDLVGLSPRQYQRLTNRTQKEASKTLYNRIVAALGEGPKTVEQILLLFPSAKVDQIRSIVHDMERENLVTRDASQISLRVETDEPVDPKEYLHVIRMQGDVDVALAAQNLNIDPTRVRDLLDELERESSTFDRRVEGAKMWAFLNFVTMGCLHLAIRKITGQSDPRSLFTGLSGPIPPELEHEFDDSMASLHQSARNVLQEDFEGKFTHGEWRRWVVMTSFGRVVPLEQRVSPRDYFDEEPTKVGRRG